MCMYIYIVCDMTYWSLKTSTHPDNMLVYNRGDPFDGFWVSRFMGLVTPEGIPKH